MGKTKECEDDKPCSIALGFLHTVMLGKKALALIKKVGIYDELKESLNMGEKFGLMITERYTIAKPENRIIDGFDDFAKFMGVDI